MGILFFFCCRNCAVMLPYYCSLHADAIKYCACLPLVSNNSNCYGYKSRSNGLLYNSSRPALIYYCCFCPADKSCRKERVVWHLSSKSNTQLFIEQNNSLCSDVIINFDMQLRVFRCAWRSFRRQRAQREQETLNLEKYLIHFAYFK